MTPTQAEREEKVAGQLHGAAYALTLKGWTPERIMDEVEHGIAQAYEDSPVLRHYEGRSPRQMYERGLHVGLVACSFDAPGKVRARARAKAQQWVSPQPRAFWLGVARGATA